MLHTAPGCRPARCRSRATVAAAGSAGSGSMAGVILAGGRLLLQFGVGAGVLAAALPTLLSSKIGTKALVSTLNYTGPGIVQIDELQLGWTQPVLVKGLRLMSNTGPDQRLLLSVQRVSSTASLLQLATGQSSVVIVSQPVIDATLDDAGEGFRMIGFLEDRGLVAKSNSRAPHFVTEASSSSAASSNQPAVDKAGASSDRLLPATIPVSSLSRATSPVQFHADLRALTAQVYLVDGTLMVPEEFRQLLGESVHVSAVMGRQQLQESKEELDLDLTWLNDMDAGSTSGVHHSRGQPAMADIRSSTISASMVGWKQDDGFLLQRPAAASLEVTPSLLRFGLSQANPLLSGVVDLHEGGRVSATFAPQGQVIPYRSATIRVEPMKLTLVSDSILGQLMEFIGRRGNAAQMEGMGSQATLGARLLDLFGRPKQSSRDEHGSRSLRTVQLWTSAMEWDIAKSGVLATHRVDMMLGAPRSGGVHVALWGSCDRVSNKISMTLGLPASTLRLLGLKNLPPNFMLTLDIGGTASQPRVNWWAASKKVAALATMELHLSAQDRERWMDHLLHSAAVWVNQESLDTTLAHIMAESLSAPIQQEPWPWQQQEELAVAGVKA